MKSETFYQHCLRKLMQGDSIEQLRQLLEDANTAWEKTDEFNLTKSEECRKQFGEKQK